MNRILIIILCFSNLLIYFFLCLVMINSSAEIKLLSLYSKTYSPYKENTISALSPNGVALPSDIDAKSAILIDLNTGKVLYNDNAYKRLPMASTTKIMTAYIALRQNDLTKIITIKQDAINEVIQNNGSSANLVAGDKLSLLSLLYGLLLPSGDDAAISIADGVSGSASAFTNLMNKTALSLGLLNTHYINPDGLTYYNSNMIPNSDEYTTAFDLAKLTQYAMKLPLFVQITNTLEMNIPDNIFHHGYNWISTNNLLSTYLGSYGIKTGFTDEAGYCLVFSARNGTDNLLGIVLGASTPNSRFDDAVTLLNWGFGLPHKYIDKFR